MAWLQIDQTLRDHHKICDAADTLGISPTLMTGMMILFWLWALDNAPTGDVTRISNGTIARAAQWTGDPEQFVKALKEQQLLDETPDGIEIHDWYEYAGKLVESRKADADRKRREREAKKKQPDRNDAECPQDVGRTSAATLHNTTLPKSTEEIEPSEGDDPPQPEEPEKPAAPVPYEKIRELFNTTCLSFSKVVGINGKRKVSVGARWSEHPDLGFWAAYFGRVESSPFLKGKNERGWKATFDWIMQPANMDKVLEGKYDKGGDDRGTGTDQRDPQQGPRDYTKGFKTCDEE